MMDKVILHISDLHVTTQKGNDGKENTKIDSYLTTSPDSSASDHYLQCFISKIKEDFSEKSFILALTGDIANTGTPKEFEFASKFVGTILKELSISPENCIVVPGDHDVHRLSLLSYLEENPNNQSHLLNSVKLKNFANFYKDIKNKEFSFDKIIVDYLIIEDKIVLVGINSNYKIDASGGEGFIPIEPFRKEIEALKASLGVDKYQYVLCWHHNFMAGYDNTNSGQWDVENRRHLLAELEMQNIKLVLNGNEHTNNTKTVPMGSITASDSGAFASIKYDTSFKIYSIKIDDNISLLNNIYGLVKTQGNDFSYFWNTRDNKGARQLEKFDLFIKNEQVIETIEELPISEEKITHQEADKTAIADPVFYNNTGIAEKLYAIVREKQLFHSGHFHWSDTSRAHNWIDVSKLLENNDELYFAQSAIIDIIETYGLATNCNLIIGLGYEGNIISSKASIKYNIPYTSLPYSYRYTDHHEYEKKLNYNNNEGDFKTVIIITDVVNDGRTIRKLIDKREKDFFAKVKKVIVLSLFYTGHQSINTNILNYDQLPNDYDLENDHKVNNIEFYTIKSLRVEKCPYGNEYKEQCFIYRDELSCVHLFYDETAVDLDQGPAVEPSRKT